MKNSDLYQFKAGLEEVSKHGDVDWAIIIVRNRKLVEKEIEILEELRKPTEEYQKKFQPELEKLAQKYALRDEHGNIIPRKLFDGSFGYEIDPKRRDEYDNELNKLRKNHHKLYTEREEQLNKFTEALKKEVNLKDLQKVNKDSIPSTITGDLLWDIRWMIEELS